MWITSLCSFPALFSDKPIDLSNQGITVIQSFKVPVDKSYPLQISFEFPSVQARINDKIVGSNYNKYCSKEIHYEQIPANKRVDLGRPIPFKVVVRKAVDNSIVQQNTFISLCLTSHIGTEKTRTIGWLNLKRGDYSIEITNLQAQSDLEKTKTSLSLIAGHGK